MSATRLLFLRAINLGATARLPMETLRAMATDLGATDVATYLATGNLLCTPPNSLPGAAFDDALAAAVGRHLGVDREVIGRTPEELRVTLDAYPFEDGDPRFAQIHLLAGEPDSARVADLHARDLRGDRVRVIGRDAHLCYAEGTGRSAITAALLARTLGVQGTSRTTRVLATVLDRAG